MPRKENKKPHNENKKRQYLSTYKKACHHAVKYDKPQPPIEKDIPEKWQKAAKNIWNNTKNNTGVLKYYTQLVHRDNGTRVESGVVEPSNEGVVALSTWRTHYYSALRKKNSECAEGETSQAKKDRNNDNQSHIEKEQQATKDELSCSGSNPINTGSFLGKRKEISSSDGNQADQPPKKKFTATSPNI